MKTGSCYSNGNQMKKAAVLPAEGIGDSLLMLIASYNLQEAGYFVTTFQPMLNELRDWLKTKEFSALPNTYELERLLAGEDIIILQNDNSAKAKHLIELKRQGKLKQLSVFYPTYQAAKHGPLDDNDYVFDDRLCMVENIAIATAKLLLLAGVSRNNGLSPLIHLQHRKYPMRVILHPTSSQAAKNWSAHKFLDLAHKLQKDGFEVIFAVSSKEHHEWSQLLNGRWNLPPLPSLSDLATLIYESGYIIGNDSLVGHLASNLQIPSLILANDAKRMRLWRPGWLKGEVLTPHSFLSYFMTKKYKALEWSRNISVGTVYKRLKKMHSQI